MPRAFDAGDIWGGFGSGDAERVTALIAQASLFAGIDSGPQKCAGATDTPAIGSGPGITPSSSWTCAPISCTWSPPTTKPFRPCSTPGRVLFPAATTATAFGPADATWPTPPPACWVPGSGQKRKTGLVKAGDFWVRDDNMEQDLVVVKDVYDGDCYRTSLLGTFADDEVIVDIGAHIGAFAKLWHKRNPRARIICVEACPENLDCLAGQRGRLRHRGPCRLHLRGGRTGPAQRGPAHCESTGGSTVLPADKLDDKSLHQPGYQYWHDRRPLPKLTLEELMAQLGVDHIDLLKLDCEGSEFSILEKTPSRSRIHFILGEYHGQSAGTKCVPAYSLATTARSAPAGRPAWGTSTCATRPGRRRKYKPGSRATGKRHSRRCALACDLPAWPPQEITSRTRQRRIAPITPSLSSGLVTPHTPSPCLSQGKVSRLALPAGIGDAFWCLLKVGACAGARGGPGGHRNLPGGRRTGRGVPRGLRFRPRRGSYRQAAHYRSPLTTPGGEFNYAPSQPALAQPL